ncbi:MAG: indole-3-glycerol phosphate synthase TrpC [archaeon]
MDILDEFIEKARENVGSGYYGAGKVSLKEKLESQGFSLIAEIKHASPAEEYSFKNINVEKTAHLFRQSGADAISVVVEPQIFKGKLENVSAAKKAGLPVLFKDFVICEEQIKAAKRFGADAILLVVKVAERLGLDLGSLIDTAHKNDLEVLLESYDEAEFKKALGTGADVLGINNRDLQTLSVDVTQTEKILSAFDDVKQPVVSESGIKSRRDVELVKKAGVSGILVGTALWTAKDIGGKIRELKGGSNG